MNLIVTRRYGGKKVLIQHPKVLTIPKMVHHRKKVPTPPPPLSRYEQIRLLVNKRPTVPGRRK